MLLFFRGTSTQSLTRTLMRCTLALCVLSLITTWQFNFQQILSPFNPPKKAKKILFAKSNKNSKCKANSLSFLFRSLSDVNLNRLQILTGKKKKTASLQMQCILCLQQIFPCFSVDPPSSAFEWIAVKRCFCKRHSYISAQVEEDEPSGINSKQSHRLCAFAHPVRQSG